MPLRRIDGVGRARDVGQRALGPQPLRGLVSRDAKEIDLMLVIDDSIASVMDYFQIFIERMMMCRGAAAFLGCTFRIRCNGTVLS